MNQKTEQNGPFHMVPLFMTRFEKRTRLDKFLDFSLLNFVTDAS